MISNIHPGGTPDPWTRHIAVMKAALFTGPGGPEVITIGTAATPVPGPNDIRVRVRAAGLNRADLMQRRGHYPAPAGWPADIPGLEYAGEVEAAGDRVQRWRVGDRVMGLVGGGAQAEAVVVHEDEALRIPDQLPFAEAAAVPEAFLTAYDALVTRARLTAGERVLIHAVGSGVGTAAVQIAKQLGATVVGTSRTAAKLERAREYGLDEGIDTSQGNFADAISAPVDVVIDVLGGPALPHNLSVLAPRGRLVLLGWLLGSKVDADFNPVLRKRLEIIGSVMRARLHADRVEVVRGFSEQMLPRFDVSRFSPPLRPVLERTVPMDQLAAAHAAMERNETFGKLVAVWD